jgi:pimeloyl-ACP methyl ester carboxylesterase
MEIRAAGYVLLFTLSACGGRDAPVTSTRVAGPAGTVAADDGGRGGLPVVLVHSLAGNSAQWSGQLQHMRQSRRAVALDFRGHGRSDPPKNGAFSMAAMAGDIAAVVDTLAIGKFVLVGHSMGGGVALEYAGAHPERVAGLLLVDPIGDGTKLPAAEVKPFLEGLKSNYDSMIEGHWTQIAGPNRAVQDRLLADLRATPRETVEPAFREVMQFDPNPALARYRGPILSIITPYNDQPFSLHRLGKGFPHRMVQGTGHWIQLDKPEEFNRLLDEFLTRVSGER